MTGGGSAGHVTPNLALIPHLLEAGYDVEYVGSYQGIERRLIESTSIPYHAISAGKLRRYFDWRNFTDVLRVLRGFAQAFLLLLRLRPQLLFSKGGFVSAPVVWAAWLLRVPVIIHESDMTIGLANKLSLPFARKICYSFTETLAYLPAKKAVYTGIPVRENLLRGDADRARQWLDFPQNKPLLLALGGSLGAEAINRTVRDALAELTKTFNVAHICGAGHIQHTLAPFSGYNQYEYLGEQLHHLFAAADVVVSRAGATTLFELLALHKPNLLIPLPHKVSRGDQILNAASFEKQGYSRVLQEEKLNKKTLLNNVRQLYRDRNKYIDCMSQTVEGQSLQRVLDTIESLLTEKNHQKK